MAEKKSVFSLKHFIKNEFKTDEELPFSTSIDNYPKGAVLITKGQTEKNLFFIRSGIVEATVVDEEGDEKIVYIAFANEFMCSLSSFITQKPTDYTLTCLTNCVLEKVGRDVIYDALEHSIITNKVLRYYVEIAYLDRLRKQKDLLTKPALKRYLELLEGEPEIVKQLTVKKMANYLGIHPRSLSRIRKL